MAELPPEVVEKCKDVSESDIDAFTEENTAFISQVGATIFANLEGVRNQIDDSDLTSDEIAILNDFRNWPATGDLRPGGSQFAVELKRAKLEAAYPSLTQLKQENFYGSATAYAKLTEIGNTSNTIFECLSQTL